MPPLRIPPAFKRTAKRKPAQMQQAIARCVELLADNPRHPGLNTHRMQGHPGVWEAYIDQGNRLTFHYEGEAIVLRKNCNHDVLRRP